MHLHTRSYCSFRIRAPPLVFIVARDSPASLSHPRLLLASSGPPRPPVSTSIIDNTSSRPPNPTPPHRHPPTANATPRHSTRLDHASGRRHRPTGLRRHGREIRIGSCVAYDHSPAGWRPRSARTSTTLVDACRVLIVRRSQAHLFSRRPTTTYGITTKARTHARTRTHYTLQ